MFDAGVGGEVITWMRRIEAIQKERANWQRQMEHLSLTMKKKAIDHSYSWDLELESKVLNSSSKGK